MHSCLRTYAYNIKKEKPQQNTEDICEQIWQDGRERWGRQWEEGDARGQTDRGGDNSRSVERDSTQLKPMGD